MLDLLPYMFGRDRWVNVDDLSPEALKLTHLELLDKVEIKGIRFEISAIGLDPPFVVLDLAEEETAVV